MGFPWLSALLHLQLAKRIFVHAEPSRRKELGVIIPVTEINGFESTIYGHFGRAPYYIILKMKDDSFEIEDFYMNEFLKL